MGHQSFISWIRQPASIILVIAAIVMLLMLIDQSQQKANTNPAQPSMSSMAAPAMARPGATIKSPGDTPANNPPAMGGDLPRIVQQLSAPTTKMAPSPSGQGPLAAPDLGSLLGRLEDKVKAEPGNINNRLLLAQTYNELGLVDKAIGESRAATKQFPEHTRAKLVLASILSKRKNEKELKEAVDVLKGLRPSKDIKQYLVEMYLGDAWIRMGEHKAAMDSWKLALEGMPVNDNRRAKLEKSIADFAAGKPGT
jgi:tetratricopeptide (TPR) repeat protein